MIRQQALLASAVLLLSSIPALAQRGGPPRGGNNFNRGGTSFGITLGNPRSGLSFSYGTGPAGNFYGVGVGGGGYRPGYYGGGFGPSYGYGGAYGFGNTILPAPYIAPRTYVVPQTYYVPQSTYVVPQTTYISPVPTQTVTPVAPPEPATPSEMGLLITELKAQGAAKAAGLRQGDVILSVDGKRIQNFEELRVLLTAAGKKQANVEFIDGSNGQIDKKDVGVVDGKMGITIEEVPLRKE
jgi:membrane-associated protease RseP (regulator of RpoE activity)